MTVLPLMVNANLDQSILSKKKMTITFSKTSLQMQFLKIFIISLFFTYGEIIA